MPDVSLERVAIRLPMVKLPVHLALRRCRGSSEDDSRPPALLLHGLGLTSYSWRYVQERMTGCRETIAVDLLGFGRSDKPAGADYSLPGLAGSIPALLDALGIERASLVGHSLGGGVALLAALAFPERVERLGLIGTVAYPQPEPPFVTLPRLPLSWLPFMLLAKPLIRAGLEQVYRNPEYLTPDAAREYAAPFFMNYSGSKTLQRLCRALDQEKLIPYVQRFPSLQTPVLVIHGDRDNVTPLWIAERLRQDLPNAEVHILEGKGHMLVEEEPETVSSLLCAFLEE